MAICSSILAWRIPRMEEPGRLYSSWGCTESVMTEHTHTHIYINYSELRQAKAFFPESILSLALFRIAHTS